MKILVVIHEYPPVGGGGGKTAEDVCKGLARRGHEVMVITPHCKGLPKREQSGSLTIERVHCLRRFAYKATLLDMGLFVTAGSLKGIQLMRQWKPDIIQAHFGVPAGAAAWLLSRWSGIPYVITAQLGDVPGGVPEKTDRVFKLIKPLTVPIWHDARIVVSSSNHIDRLTKKAYPGIHPVIIPNGFDFEQIRTVKFHTHKIPQIAFAGRLVIQKDPLQIIKTLSQIKDLAWKAVIAGDGPLYPQVKQAAHDAGLDERVQMIGWVDPQDVLQIFNQSDILFMPSVQEGLPLAGLQGLASGLAMVLSSAGSNQDLVLNGKNGECIQIGDNNAYAVALRALIEDPEKLASARQISREHAKKFDLELILDQYEALFTTIQHEVK